MPVSYTHLDVYKRQVIESEATGDGDEQVTVAFPGVGIKKLLVSLAGLKKL